MREEGYYFVKYKGDWTIGYTDNHPLFPWTLAIGTDAYREEDINEIGDKIELPKD